MNAANWAQRLFREIGHAALLVLVIAFVVAAVYGSRLTRISSSAIYPEMHLANLARAADMVILARPEASDTRSGGRVATVVTDTAVTVERVMKGPTLSRLVVTTLGGRLGNTIQTVEDEITLAPGRTVVLFLSRVPSGELVVAGGSQGVWVIQGDRAGNGVESALLAEIAKAAKH